MTVITHDHPNVTVNIDRAKAFSKPSLIKARIQPEHQFKISPSRSNGFTGESEISNDESFSVVHFVSFQSI
jgi:hypothetical protein